MLVWAIVALIFAALVGWFAPNLTLPFESYEQEVWQVLYPVVWMAMQFSLPLSAALFVGSMIMRRMPDQDTEG